MRLLTRRAAESPSPTEVRFETVTTEPPPDAVPAPKPSLQSCSTTQGFVKQMRAGKIKQAWRLLDKHPRHQMALMARHEQEFVQEAQRRGQPAFIGKFYRLKAACEASQMKAAAQSQAAAVAQHRKADASGGEEQWELIDIVP